MKKGVIYIFIFFVLTTTTILISRSFRVDKIPNGSKFSCSNCHVSPAGGGARNAFGQDVESRVTPGGTENFWDPTLANIDSDGDGFTNGVELQDPNGTWTSGSIGNFSLVTNPGNANSKPNPTSVENEFIALKYQLYNNYPNPFNPSTNIAFEIAQPEFVSLKVYSINGELIKSILNENLPAGRFENIWDGKDESGNQVSSGIYLYRLTAGKFDKSARMILMK
ncbi:MAG: FlgD immunoglobulin-like domain containing protein [Bacteroidota bacterium]